MADEKISGLMAILAVDIAADDLLTVVDVSALDPFRNKKLRKDQLASLFDAAGAAAAVLAAGITVGTTAVASGTTTRVLYDNAGTLGEYAITGTGNVVMSQTPTFQAATSGKTAIFKAAATTPDTTAEFQTSAGTAQVVITNADSQGPLGNGTVQIPANNNGFALTCVNSINITSGFVYVADTGGIVATSDSANRITLGSTTGFLATIAAAGGKFVIKRAASPTAPAQQLQTTAGASLGNVSGGVVKDIIATVSTTHTDGTFDTLDTTTFVANALIVNGDSVWFDYTITVVGHAITTSEVKLTFGAILIFDSAALALGTGTSTIRLTGYISRVTSTTCEASISWQASGGASIVLGSADIQTFTGPATLTGMTLTGTNALVLSAASASTNAASGDISVVHGKLGIMGFGS